jgi:hypothetical protein
VRAASYVHLADGVVRRTPGAETKERLREMRIENRHQNLRNRLLNQTNQHRWNPEKTDTTVSIQANKKSEPVN